MFVDKTLGKFKVDQYCKEAKIYSRQNGLCTNCPFRECLFSLKPAEKKMVLNAPVIQTAFNLHDNGISISDIAGQLKLTYDRIYSWLQNRSQIEEKLRLYL